MLKEIILLAASKKYNNLCVAGIDTKNGNWVRVISDDISIHNAVKVDDFYYEDGSVPKILDKVRIEFKEHKPNYFQPENYVYDNGYYWQKMGEVSIYDALKIDKLGVKEHVFFDANKKIHNEYIANLPDKEKYSLMLINPINARIIVTEWPERKDITVSFNYNGYEYQYFSLTDIEYKKIYLSKAQGQYPLGQDVCLVISLGERYELDKCHYKLVTTIIK